MSPPRHPCCERVEERSNSQAESLARPWYPEKERDDIFKFDTAFRESRTRHSDQRTAICTHARGQNSSEAVSNRRRLSNRSMSSDNRQSYCNYSSVEHGLTIGFLHMWCVLMIGLQWWRVPDLFCSISCVRSPIMLYYVATLESCVTSLILVSYSSILPVLGVFR